MPPFLTATPFTFLKRYSDLTSFLPPPLCNSSYPLNRFSSFWVRRRYPGLTLVHSKFLMLFCKPIYSGSFSDVRRLWQIYLYLYTYKNAFTKRQVPWVFVVTCVSFLDYGDVYITYIILLDMSLIPYFVADFTWLWLLRQQSAAGWCKCCLRVTLLVVCIKSIKELEI